MNKKSGAIILSLGLVIAIVIGVYLFFIKPKGPETDEPDDSGNKNVASGKIDTCPGCKFMYSPNIDMWTAWNTEGKTPTKITSKLSDSYLEITKSSGKRYFLGVKLNDANEVTNIYGCGIQDDVPFCVTATSDGSKYESNKRILKNKVWHEFFKTEKYTEDNVEYEVTYCLPSVEILAVQIFSEGTIKLGDDNNNVCSAISNGYFRCWEE